MSAEDDLASLPPTAPGGGDFGVALNNRTDTIDESGIGGPSRLKLTVRPPPPQYPYADTFFSFEVEWIYFSGKSRGLVIPDVGQLSYQIGCNVHTAVAYPPSRSMVRRSSERGGHVYFAAFSNHDANHCLAFCENFL